MPVVVVGASGLIGQRAVAAFGRVSPEVRAFVRRPEAAAPLRALGAKVATGWLGDVDNLATVFSRAHTVCHLVGGLNLPTEEAYREQNLTSVELSLRAAEQAGVERFLFVSYPGASPDSPNPYLRFKGLAEEAVLESGLEAVVLRCTHVFGTGSEWLASSVQQARRFPAVVVGTGRQVLAPVFVDDLASVLAAADDRRGVKDGIRGLEGPERLTADAWSDLLAGRVRRKLHVAASAAQRLSKLTGRTTSLPLLEILAADSVADAPDAAAEFAVERTPLTEALARSLGDRTG